MRKGSITVFFSLVLTMLCSLFFSMSETIRILGMENRSSVITREALGSACSEYQPYLWETYSILALDSAYGQEYWTTSLVENRMDQFCCNNCEGEGGLFQMEPVGCQLLEYGLLTDGNGAVFMHQAANMAKKQMSQEAIEDWRGKAEAVISDGRPAFSVESQVDAAKEALNNIQQETESREAAVAPSEEQSPPMEFDNPFTIFQLIKEKGWLGLVTEGIEFSDKTMAVDGVVSRRQLQRGTKDAEFTREGNTSNRWLYQWYLLHQFAHYGQDTKGAGLAYQAEYIIAGKSTDRENLETVVGNLLAMRQIKNVLTITTNPGMLQQTYQVALSLAGASANPALVQVVQTGVVSIWALVESMLDVRTLLAGGKVAFIKTAQQWTSQLYSLAAYIPPSIKATETEAGITYEQYLAGQLFLLDDKSLGLRPLDLMEEDLRRQEGYTNVRMDRMICSMEVVCKYQSYPLFLSVMGTESFKGDWYSNTCREVISY